SRRPAIGCGCGARTSPPTPTPPPWAGGWSTCARRAARWSSCSCRPTASTRARTRRWPSPPSRPSSPGPSTPRWPRPACVRGALRQGGLPGGFEVVDRTPLVIVDGAHNPDGAATVADTLAEDFDVRGKVVYVVGMLAGRDVEAVLDAMGARAADLVVACAPDS